MRFGILPLIALFTMAGCQPHMEDPDDGDSSGWDLRQAAADTPLFAVSKQRRGVYPVGSRVQDREAPGGFGPCARYPKNLGEQDWGVTGQVSLLIFPDESVHFGEYRGLAVRLINRTDDQVAFQASDSCLYLVQEARTESGEWLPIESLPDP